MTKQQQSPKVTMRKLRALAIPPALVCATALANPDLNDDRHGEGDAYITGVPELGGVEQAWENAHPSPSQLWRVKVPLTPALPGTIGSGLAFDKSDNLYWMVTDKASATTDWPLRLVRVKVTPTEAEIVQIIPLRENGLPLTGADLDPEDVVVAPDGTLWLCDENRPYLFHVTRSGDLIERVEPPANLANRVNNQGLEGVAISANGATVYAILQSGLQTEADKLNTILLAYDVASRVFRQYRYRLDDPRRESYPAGLAVRMGANGLVTVGENALLVIERDNQKDDLARVKRVYRVEIPSEPPPTPLAKALVVDLYQLGYRFEKLEGLAAPHPRHLVVVNDNDGDLGVDTEVWQMQF